MPAVRRKVIGQKRMEKEKERMKKPAQNGKNPTLQRLSSEYFCCYPCAFIIRMLFTSWKFVLPPLAFDSSTITVVFKQAKGSALAVSTALVRQQLKYSALFQCPHTEKKVKLWEGDQKGWKENPCKDGLIGLIILDRSLPMKNKKSLRSVPPESREVRFGSCPGEFKLPSPISQNTPDAERSGGVRCALLLLLQLSVKYFSPGYRMGWRKK